MDPLTHALSGAALARAIPGEPLPRTKVILLILLAMAPDADFVLKFFSDALYLEYHRGVTHSVLMLPLWTWLIYALLPNRRSAEPLMPWLIGMALAMHIFLDLITSFGTMLLAPVSDWRAALDLVFIIDPVFTACLALPLVLMFIWENKARMLAACALILMFSYVGLTGYSHYSAVNLTKSENPQALSCAALPLPFSPFHWQLIATYPDHYRRASVDLFPAFPGTSAMFPTTLTTPYLQQLTAPEKLQWQSLTRMDSINLEQGLPGVSFYRWFSRFPVLLARDATHYEFGDLRFYAGVEGMDSSFKLRIKRGKNPKAWLLWRKKARTPLD